MWTVEYQLRGFGLGAWIKSLTLTTKVAGENLARTIKALTSQGYEILDVAKEN